LGGGHQMESLRAGEGMSIHDTSCRAWCLISFDTLGEQFGKGRKGR
jgi:hypothetical protein